MICFLIWICIVCMSTSLVSPAPGPLVLDIVDMAAISRMTPYQLEMLAEGLAAEAIMRTKRSSATSALNSAIKASAATATSTILRKKASLLGQASMGSASYLSSSSSKSGSSDHGYTYEPQEEKVDFLGLKKSILYTLFQAVKAITGGVTILKGQLIKGGGALAATLGKVISKKGDLVSNLGKKIVNSAALSHKPSSTAAGPVYGPPPAPTHYEYGPPPTGYGAPTAPAHYAHTAVAAPTGWGAHKYPAQLDGRGKLSGVHAGLVILTPLEESPLATTPEIHEPVNTPLEPPPSILSNVFSAFTAIKDVFASKLTPTETETLNYQVPPTAPSSYLPAPAQMWGAVNSYGEPAMVDTFTDYDPRTGPLDYATAKKSVVPNYHRGKGLSPEKLQKMNENLDKINILLNEHQRSSEDLPKLNTNYDDALKSKFMSTDVVTDNEIGVLPGDLLTNDSTTTTTASPKNTTTSQSRSKKEIKFVLRGNKIVQV